MYIVSLSVEKRFENIPEIQNILTKYGKDISARLGIHACKQNKEGLIIIVYEADNIDEFVKELKTIEKVNINYMEA